MNSALFEIGNNIKSLRQEAGLSQGDLSKICGVERAQISRIEAGEVNGVSYYTIERLFNSLGRTLEPIKLEEKKIQDLHPFVKWAGGKTQLLDVISKRVPDIFNRYYEPFVGGGALLLKLQPKFFSINDTNSELMAAFDCFRNDESFEQLKKLLEEHERNHSEDYYYKIRELDRSEEFAKMSQVEKAARMIYLNKACFNGLYRVSSKGYFNVPFGKKEKVNCFDRENFDNLRQYFNKKYVTITTLDFEDALKGVVYGDFVYLDPPYDTWEDKDSFTSYSKDAFGKDEQKRLARVFRDLANKGAFVMLSNHNTEFIRELYSDYIIEVVEARRNINSNGQGRGTVEEVIITNYVKEIL